jgi:hypothetical protein
VSPLKDQKVVHQAAGSLLRQRKLAATRGLGQRPIASRSAHSRPDLRAFASPLTRVGQRPSRFLHAGWPTPSKDSAPAPTAGGEKMVPGDAAYQGVTRRQENADKAIAGIRPCGRACAKCPTRTKLGRATEKPISPPLAHMAGGALCVSYAICTYRTPARRCPVSCCWRYGLTLALEIIEYTVAGL